MDYDLTVIGAGITGAGVAQAGAAAGYKVLLLEAGEVGHATSSKSSKLIHGGLRYLESAQLSLVRESLHERELLLKLAPGLVKLAPLHIPVYESSSRSRATIFAGLSLYRLLSGWDPSTRFTQLKPSQWEALDGINTQGLRGVFRYYEAQTDDRQLTRAVVASACSLGAELQTGARLTSAARHAFGCDLEYVKSSQHHHLRTRVLINCAGPWAAQVNGLIDPAPELPGIDLVQGSHLLLPPLLQHHYYLESPTDGRAVFALPWRGQLLVGTTETPHTGAPEAAECHPQEMHYLINVLKHYFPQLHILPSSAETFAGLRVLPHSNAAAFGRSREVMMIADNQATPRVLTVMGGKLTTYRATARQVIERVYPSLPAARGIADTAQLPLSP